VYPLLLQSDGTASGTTLAALESRITGEESWWVPSHGTAGIAVNEKTALRLAAVLATVNTLATDVAVLPLDVYRSTGPTVREKVTDHPVAELLTRSPDGRSTPSRWFASLLGHALTGGNGYAEIQRTGRGLPYKLHLLDPISTYPEARDGRDGYRIDSTDRGGWLESANVLHLAGFGYDGQCGYNFIRLCDQTIGLGLAAQSYGADYFANGSTPGGIIETPERLKAEAVKQLREGWEGEYGGAGNRHRTAVLTGGAKFNAITGDPESSQLNETRKFQVTDATRPWRVPPHKIGDFSQAHLSNIEASNLDYLTTALMWWLVGLQEECNLKLFTASEYRAGYFVEHNTNALLKADVAGRFSAYEIAIRNGWMNRDEVRARENLNPIGEAGGGDLYTIQAQNIPLDQSGRTAAVAPPPAGAAPTPAPRSRRKKKTDE
jgi:HK97 family phage portal protein